MPNPASCPFLKVRIKAVTSTLFTYIWLLLPEVMQSQGLLPDKWSKKPKVLTNILPFSSQNVYSPQSRHMLSVQLLNSTAKIKVNFVCPNLSKVFSYKECKMLFRSKLLSFLKWFHHFSFHFLWSNIGVFESFCKKN